MKTIATGLRKIHATGWKVRLPHLLGQRLVNAGFQVHPEPLRLVLYRLVVPSSGTELHIYFNFITIQQAADVRQVYQLLRAAARGEPVSTTALAGGGAK